MRNVSICTGVGGKSSFAGLVHASQLHSSRSSGRFGLRVKGGDGAVIGSIRCMTSELEASSQLERLGSIAGMHRRGSGTRARHAVEGSILRRTQASIQQRHPARDV